jgi:hypothetical protein
MWSLGGPTGAGRPNSGEPPPGLAREGRGKGAGVARGRFGGDLGAEVACGGACIGHRRCWPRLPAAAVAAARTPVLPGSPGFGRLRWRIVVASARTNGRPVAGRGSSPWPAMAARWQLAVQAGAGATGRGAARLFK